MAGWGGVRARAGRPKESVQSRRAWELRAAGVLNPEIAELLGVHVVTLNAWWRTAGGIRPRKIAVASGRYLSLEERIEIDALRRQGRTKAEIARVLGRHPSTIGRELERNSQPRTPSRPTQTYRAYLPLRAHRRAQARMLRPRPSKLEGTVNRELHDHVQAKLLLRWSPEQIARDLPLAFPDRPEMRVSHETIYQSLYVQGRGSLRRELTTCLRTGRAIRRPERSATTRTSRIPAEILISERPAIVEDRAVPGHWEGDLIIGEDNGSAIATLVERTTRFVILVRLPTGRGAEQVRDALIVAITKLPKLLRASLTWDQGAELARHADIKLATGMDIWFCDPHSPWQRGSNENTNGLLRQYFPKGTDLSPHTQEHLDHVAAELNGRPRKTLDWKKPHEALNELLATTA